MSAQAQDPRPFLSVVVPTGSVGEQALRETLLCLVGQDDHDFEALLVVPADPDPYGPVDAVVGAVVADQPPRLASRLRVVRATGRTPGDLRNAGVAASRGRYLVVLPEGDLVLGSWVATFRAAESTADGRILRALGVVQDHAVVDVAGREAVRALASPRSASPAAFSVWQHALEPLTPAAGWAWPRQLVDTQALSYDASVLDDPDWELLVRAAQLVGVVDLDTVTSIRRNWSEEASATRPGPAGSTAQERIDEGTLSLPPGEAARMRAGSSESAAQRALADELARVREELRLTHDHASNLEKIVEDLRRTVKKLEARVARLKSKLEAARADEKPSGEQSPTPRGRAWRPHRRRDAD